MEAETSQQGDDINLITIEEGATIESFKREVLFLFSEIDQCVRLSFIVTNDVVEGNGMVVLHITPNKTSPHLYSSQPVRKKSVSTVSPRESITLVSPAPVLQQSAFTSVKSGKKNRSILARTSRRPSLLQSASITRKVEDEISALMVGSPSQVSASLSVRSQESSVPMTVLSYDTLVKNNGVSESDLSEEKKVANENSNPHLTFSIPVLSPSKTRTVDIPETDSSGAVEFPTFLPNTSIELKDISISPSSDITPKDPLAALLDASAPHPTYFNYASSVFVSSPVESWDERIDDNRNEHRSDHQDMHRSDHQDTHQNDKLDMHRNDQLDTHQNDQLDMHQNDHSNNHQEEYHKLNYPILQQTTEVTTFTPSDSDSVFTHQEDGSPGSDGWFFQRVPMERLSSDSTHSESNLIKTTLSSLSSHPIAESECVSEAPSSSSVPYCQYFGCHRLIYDTSGNSEHRRCHNCGFIFCDEVSFLSSSHS